MVTLAHITHLRRPTTPPYPPRRASTTIAHLPIPFPTIPLPTPHIPHALRGHTQAILTGQPDVRPDSLAETTVQMATALLPTTLRASLDLAAMMTSPTHDGEPPADGRTEGRGGDGDEMYSATEASGTATATDTGEGEGEDDGTLARMQRLLGKYKVGGASGASTHTTASEDEGE